MSLTIKNEVKKPERVCGTCQHHERDGKSKKLWKCTNCDSDQYDKFTVYEDKCEAWGKRSNELPSDNKV